MAEEKPDMRGSGGDYQAFKADQDTEIHTGYYIEDIRKVETAPWDLTGVEGAIINLEGMEGMNDIHVHELPPGAEMQTQHHLFEEITYVLDGDGATVIGPKGEETTVEWSTGALFAIPRGTRYRHINVSKSQPVRLMSTTDLPLTLALFKDREIVFDPPFHATGVGESEYYSDGKLWGEGKNLVWQANFIPGSDLIEKVESGSRRGTGGSLGFDHPDLSMWSHISKIEVGQYRNIHRHHPGANILVEQGEGYSLMWPSNDPDAEKMRIDWQPGTVFTPPALWWHEHFNLSDQQARYFAFHASDVLFASENSVFDYKADYNIIDYPDEDPEIREMFERDLEQRGRESRMPERLYEEGSVAVFSE